MWWHTPVVSVLQVEEGGLLGGPRLTLAMELWLNKMWFSGHRLPSWGLGLHIQSSVPGQRQGLSCSGVEYAFHKCEPQVSTPGTLENGTKVILTHHLIRTPFSPTMAACQNIPMSALSPILASPLGRWGHTSDRRNPASILFSWGSRSEGKTALCSSGQGLGRA